MKNLWRKWSYEMPLAFGDALWEVLVVQFADFLSRLTVRRVLEFVAIAILVMAFAQTAPIDLALLFAGDTLMYLEFVVMIRLVAGRDHVRAMLRLVARLARLAIRLQQGLAVFPIDPTTAKVLGRAGVCWRPRDDGRFPHRRHNPMAATPPAIDRTYRRAAGCA